MNKKRFITLLIIILLIVIGFGITSFVRSFHKVDVTFANGVTEKIYNKSNSKNIIETLSKNSIISLKNGTYCGVPTTQNFSQIPICFIVNNRSGSVNFNPDYSSDTLSNLLVGELSSINAVIASKYSPIISDYTIDTGTLFLQGQWYGTTLTEKVEQSQFPDIYRVVLKKINNIWTVVVYPQLVLSSLSYPTIPFEVLNNTNKLVGSGSF